MTETWQPTASQAARVARANCLAGIRQFFQGRSVLEVQTPIYSMAGTTDPMIESFRAVTGNSNGYLITSPEFHMKRLLASGSGDIYQITPVFRSGEAGRNHNPEFTMLEWYRVGLDYLQLAEEVVQLIRFLMADTEIEIQVKSTKYSEIFQRSFGLDIHTVSQGKLKRIAKDYGILPDQQLSKEGLLDLLMGCEGYSQLPDNQLTIVYDYPSSQASLAKLNHDKPPMAERFEILWGGLEIANGFSELQDPVEQLKRFNADNDTRKTCGLEDVVIDEQLLLALHGLPNCSGVAVGIDRLLMRLMDVDTIDGVLNFPIDRA